LPLFADPLYFSLFGLGLTCLFDALLAGDSLARPLARTGVALRLLTADGQAPAMSYASIAMNIDKTRYILGHLTLELPFDDKVPVDDLGYPADLVFGQFLGTDGRLDAGFRAYLPGPVRPDSEYMRQPDPQRFVVRNVYTYDTRHNISC
jgi:hypothetical protein